jgi:NAD(P)-dependent dehydrogenase (short-subunit alcohol dehydrogenase family)
MFELEDKTCLVVGGTSGLGAAIAQSFVAAGARVAVASSNSDKVAAMAERLGEGHMATRLDVTDEASVAAAVAAAHEGLGRLDVLVNAAGITQRMPSLQATLEHWETVLRTNLTGTFLTCREAGRMMTRQTPRGDGERGCILNIASLVAFRGFEGVAAYGASKAGVVNLTKSLATDWAPHGIRVNAIAPGVFLTDLNRELVAGTPRGEWLRGHTALDRFGEVKEICGAALYLCSDWATYVTGEVVSVDGGFLSLGVGPRQQAPSEKEEGT